MSKLHAVIGLKESVFFWCSFPFVTSVEVIRRNRFDLAPTAST